MMTRVYVDGRLSQIYSAALRIEFFPRNLQIGNFQNSDKNIRFKYKFRRNAPIVFFNAFVFYPNKMHHKSHSLISQPMKIHIFISNIKKERTIEHRITIQQKNIHLYFFFDGTFSARDTVDIPLTNFVVKRTFAFENMPSFNDTMIN